MSRLIRFALALVCVIFSFLSCNKTECLPAASEELWIVIENSVGNNIIHQDYPNLILELSDNVSSHFLNSVNVTDGSVTQ